MSSRRYRQHKHEREHDDAFDLGEEAVAES
jgi:hypothetical protein